MEVALALLFQSALFLTEMNAQEYKFLHHLKAKALDVPGMVMDDPM